VRAAWQRRWESLGRSLLAGATFFATIYPYARSSKRIFGSYLHNINTSWVVWCDSFEQYIALTKKVDVLHLPASDVPSPAHYWSSHTVPQMVWRETRGLAEMFGNTFISHGYAWFVLAYLAFFCILLRDPAYRRDLFRRSARASWPFAVTYLMVYVGVFGFWAAISAGNRFVLGLAAPALFALGAAIEHFPDEHRVQRFDRWMKRAIIVGLVTYYPYAICTHYSGG
jgi:hypothetical protein